MCRLLGTLAILLLVLGIGAARADEVSGVITAVNPVMKTITVSDKVFTVSPTNTVGPNLAELREGDKVRIFYSSRGKSQTSFNAMTIAREE